MLLEFENKIAGFAKTNGLFESVDKVLLAVSGGADSTALMYAMRAMKAEGALSAEGSPNAKEGVWVSPELLCAHINHQLRGTEADLDEDFVIAQARNLNFPITTRRLDVRGFARKNKLSIETAARKLRIESLLDIAKANNCNRIATAHQKNDNAETVLQRLLRGTGFRGLGGIWPMRSFAEKFKFVRPLLCVRRGEIIEYLKERNLKWRIDRTNDDCRYKRNFIRHRLLPALQQDCSGSIVEQLSQLSQSAQRFYKLVCDSAEKVWPVLADCASDSLKLNLKSFLTQPEPVKVELVRRSLVCIGSGERYLTQGHFKRILQLAEQNISGREIVLPDGFVARREYEDLVFERTTKSPWPGEQISKSIKVKVPGRTRFGNYLIEATISEAEEARFERFKAKKNNFIEWFDLEKVNLPLVVRFREAGDRFWPLGFEGEKKIGKFLTAARINHKLRKEVIIIADNDKIIWVAPVRASELTKIIATTKSILQIRLRRLR